MIKKIHSYLFLLNLAPLLFTNLSAEDSSIKIEENLQDEMIQDLNILKYNMSVKYAPKDVKYTLFGWNLNDEYQIAKSKIKDSKAQNSKDYQKIFKEFIASTKDYHVSTHFYSREMSIYPISFKEAEGRYFITNNEFSANLDTLDFMLMDWETVAKWVDDIEQSLENKPAYEIGDEILAINGVSPKTIIEKIIDKDLGGNRSPTGYALANAIVFNKMAKYGHETSEGTFRLTILPKGKNRPVTYELPWLHFSEDLLDRNLSLATSSEDSKPIKSAEHMKKLMQKNFCVGIANDLTTPHKSSLKQKLYQTDGDDEITYIRGFLPDLGRVIWKTKDDSQLYAYIYQHKSGKKIGYLYLPTFMYEDPVLEEVLDDLAKIFTTFNDQTVALVLDITNNPGGRSDYMNAVLSTITDKPMTCHQHQELLIQEDVYRAMAFNELIKYFEEDENIEEVELEKFKEIKKYFTQVINDYKAGKTITDPLYLFGEKEIKANPTNHYTKPILVLVNELDFSCGDFFPAMLQDNNRATIFGKTTAGAGGYVNYFPSSSRFGVAGYSLTGSIGYRLDGTPIENMGVTPDIEYDLTTEDLQNNYKDYKEAVNREIGILLSK
ncbi:MAG: protease-like activity factor CPAF [Chlamydiota bacterium]|nr:protease-like activity factor CPAF [Chlamydiota bacterium]